MHALTSTQQHHIPPRYTYGSPSSMVQILSSEPTSSAADSALLLATLEFEVVGVGETWFSGVVVDTLTSDGETIGERSRSIVAGQIYFESLDTAGRRHLDTAASNTAFAAVRGRGPQPSTQLRSLQSSTLMRGDTNGDGSFTVSDLDFIKRCVGWSFHCACCCKSSSSVAVFVNVDIVVDIDRHVLLLVECVPYLCKF